MPDYSNNMSSHYAQTYSKEYLFSFATNLSFLEMKSKEEQIRELQVILGALQIITEEESLDAAYLKSELEDLEDENDELRGEIDALQDELAEFTGRS